MKIATILGARPQFVKASMVSKEIGKHDHIQEIIIHTGQHFDSNMSHIFFEEMGIPEPHCNLGIQSQSHGAMTGRQLEAVEKVLEDEKPDWVLVYGDTNSTLAGALAAAKLHIPVAHVEAGLRSYNRKMPEEINRVLTDHIADILLVPTDTAVENLLKEGIVEQKIKKVGDVMYDAILHFAQIAEEKSNILADLHVKEKEYILATIHRPENTDNPERLKNIFAALAEAPMPVIIPLHPRTKKKLEEFNITLNCKINVIEPVGYLDMFRLEKYALEIATDSGGVQKEAYFHNVPCIILRKETEWVELTDLDFNVLVGTDPKKIISAMNTKNNLNVKKNIYGDGDTSKKIIDALMQ